MREPSCYFLCNWRSHSSPEYCWEFLILQGAYLKGGTILQAFVIRNDDCRQSRNSKRWAERESLFRISCPVDISVVSLLFVVVLLIVGVLIVVASWTKNIDFELALVFFISVFRDSRVGIACSGTISFLLRPWRCESVRFALSTWEWNAREF